MGKLNNVLGHTSSGAKCGKLDGLSKHLRNWCSSSRLTGTPVGEADCHSLVEGKGGTGGCHCLAHA